MTKISIALATYNGQAYLEEQISSLVSQSRSPDELVIVDDNSTDSTIEYLKSLQSSLSFDVKIIKNPNNLGHQASFGIAIQACTGDIIFLCDQDDVWHKDKIKKIEDIFSNQPQTLIAINDLDICDSKLNKLGYSVIEQTKNSGTYGKDGKSFIIGCATAFRSSLKPLITPIPSVPYGHDKWIHEIGNLFSCRKIVEEKLQFYRRHGNNSSTWAFDIKRKATWNDMVRPSQNLDIRLAYLNQLEILLVLYRRLLEISPNDYQKIGATKSKSEAISTLEKAISATASRLDLLGSSLLSIKIKSIEMLISGKYGYFLGFRSFAKDFLIRRTVK